jgi:amino acid transporter
VSPALTAVLVTALAIALGAFALGRIARREGGSDRPERPWWGSPAVWIGVSVAFILLGVFVAPRMLGFTFLFLPLIWMRLPRGGGGAGPGQWGGWGHGPRGGSGWGQGPGDDREP